MKKVIAILFLLSVWALTACQVITPPNGTIPPAAPQELYVPRDVRFAYGLGTRSADGNPGPNYWQNHSVHNMRITVAPPSRTISATQEITFTNNSPYALPGVVIKLLQNVHRPDAMRETVYPESFLTDGIQIDEFRVNGIEQPWGPDSGFAGIHVVPISPTLASKASINFTISWHFDLADHLDRTKEGAVDETTFFLAYFFPRLAVADDVNPSVWDLYEFSYGSREMYNDFADFTVSVNAPKNFIVWATGDLQNPDEVLQPDYAQRLQDSMTSDEIINVAQPEEIQQGLVTAQTDTVTWQWQANNVPDFVVALSDHYIWDAGSVVVDPATGRRASVQAAYDAPATDFQQMVEFGRSALDFASTQWPGVPYPYSKTTIFRGLADEEYPMFANDSSTGDPTFKQALHEFIARWNGKHPIPWDMFNTFNDAAGENYNWFFNRWFFEHNYIDLAVGDVQSVTGGYAVQVQNLGGMPQPFDVSLVYTDNTTESFRQNPVLWQNSPQAATITLDTAKTVVTLTLDGGIFMDATPTNNSWINPDATSEATAAPEVTITDPVTTTVEVTATTELTTSTPPTAALNQLRANRWQWISYIGPVETYLIDNPAGYTLTFNDDATINIQADCNNASGTYQGEGGKLTIAVGPMTRVACLPDSRSTEFVTLLGYAADYFFEEGHLHIDLLADGGTLVLAPVGEEP